MKHFSNYLIMFLVAISPLVSAQQQKAKNQKVAQQAANALKEDELFPKIWIEYDNLSEKAWDEKLPEATREKYKKQYYDLRKTVYEEMAKFNKIIFKTRHKHLKTQNSEPIPEGLKLKLNALNYPFVNGSTSTNPLAALIACRLLASDYEWVEKNSGYSRGPFLPMFYNRELAISQYRLQAKTKPRENQRIGIMINRLLAVHSGTHGAYVSLLKKESDLILVARKPYEKEIDEAKKNDVEFDVVPIALDALVFITHRANPVKNLSTKQIKGIYKGDIEKWEKVGGAKKGITAYIRNESSGSQQLMLSEFMKETPMKILKNEKWRRQMIRSSMGGPYSALTRDRYGIAYSVYFYEHFMSASPYTHSIAVDGVEPTSETIGSRKYPYITEVYAAIRKGTPKDSNAYKLREWLLSKEGQSVVKESGYVPIKR